MYAGRMSDATSPRSGGNQLAAASSSYLRSAQHQPVHWHAWGEEAFRRAESEDKPILLDIGAVWCHWCHVMDRESYEDAEIAAIINKHYIAVKVDRDERPDVDARYQAAVSSISGQGGWPLTGFLTPDGRPFYGATYIPREPRYGRPGMAQVLVAMAGVWQTQREEALAAASQVMHLLESNENFSSVGDLSLVLVEKIAQAIVRKFDAQQGGFGTQPKFPHPSAIDLLLETRSEESDAVVKKTLEAMARGGVYDQLAGGFHRYSVDDHWRVPHFEKMLYDNTELLRNYVHGAQRFAREDFAETAREIVAWMDGTLSDRAGGGFYVSQDADVGLDDDGDFFTWTMDEAKAALDAEEFAFAVEHWGLRAVGDMHHNPAKCVLHIATSLEAGTQAIALRDRVRAKLLSARNQREIPFIDRTLYTSWNAMGVTAYLEAARALRMDAARAFALKTLDRLLEEAWDGARTLAHVIAYPDGARVAELQPGTLDDYAFTVHACVEAWQATGALRYFEVAETLATAMVALFYDRTANVFYDVAQAEAMPLGVLGARRRPIQDSPTPAGNPTAASALLRLAALNGNADLRAVAEDALESFAGLAEQYGLFAASYGLAVARLLRDPVQVVVVGEGEEAARMEQAALADFAVGRTVVRLAPSQIAAGALPLVLKETLGPSSHLKEEKNWALVCKGRVCLPPVFDADSLRASLQ
jgi:uncharacterized protein